MSAELKSFYIIKSNCVFWEKSDEEARNEFEVFSLVSFERVALDWSIGFVGECFCGILKFILRFSRLRVTQPKCASNVLADNIEIVLFLAWCEAEHDFVELSIHLLDNILIDLFLWCNMIVCNHLDDWVAVEDWNVLCLRHFEMSCDSMIGEELLGFFTIVRYEFPQGNSLRIFCLRFRLAKLSR